MFPEGEDTTGADPLSLSPLSSLCPAQEASLAPAPTFTLTLTPLTSPSLTEAASATESHPTPVRKLLQHAATEAQMKRREWKKEKKRPHQLYQLVSEIW